MLVIEVILEKAIREKKLTDVKLCCHIYDYSNIIRINIYKMRFLIRKNY